MLSSTFLAFTDILYIFDHNQARVSRKNIFSLKKREESEKNILCSFYSIFFSIFQLFADIPSTDFLFHQFMRIMNSTIHRHLFNVLPGVALKHMYLMHIFTNFRRDVVTIAMGIFIFSSLSASCHLFALTDGMLIKLWFNFSYFPHLHNAMRRLLIFFFFILFKHRK